MRKPIPRLLIDGRIVSPAEMKHIVERAEAAGLKTSSSGSRQESVVPESGEVQSGSLLDFGPIRIGNRAVGKSVENIVSSYVSTDIFPTTSWITGDRYLYILEQIKHDPSLKINITEPQQRIVPLF